MATNRHPETPAELEAALSEGRTVVVSYRRRDMIAAAEAMGLLVRVDRRSAWGNPYRMRDESERENAILGYRAYVRGKPELLARLSELRGRALACWCAPPDCHGDVLAELAEMAPAQLSTYRLARRSPKEGE